MVKMESIAEEYILRRVGRDKEWKKGKKTKNKKQKMRGHWSSGRKRASGTTFARRRGRLVPCRRDQRSEGGLWTWCHLLPCLSALHSAVCNTKTLIITPRLYVHVLPPPTYLGNTNNLQIHLYPLHNRYGWTVSDVDKKSQ